MSLDKKYDTFYHSSCEAQHIQDLPVRRWPRDRSEAIVAVEGTGDSILDIGCGDGRLLYQFRHRYKRLVGLEYSATRLAQAKANLASWPFEGLEGSAEAISSLADSVVDRIVSADVIEHIPDVYAAASEMFRVLKPGGLLVINTPISLSPKSALYC